MVLPSGTTVTEVIRFSLARISGSAAAIAASVFRLFARS
jgi:hypothetical protein